MASLAGLLIASSALAQSNVPPSYGHDFVTIGAAGNRAMLESERVNGSQYSLITRPIGAVGYEYRLSRTETTQGQWLAFVQVAWPVWREVMGPSFGYGPAFSSVGIGYFGPDSNPTFTFNGLGPPTLAVGISWRAAAMYCNWLHNGRQTGPGAADSVRSGAYDVSTFRQYPDRLVADQQRRSPGAKYWIPDLDEWTKAAYYDPNRYGPGQDGYWAYPNRSQQPPVYGPPGQGETGGAELLLPVGSYPNTQSPWGLLDMSGGYEEWTETVLDPRTSAYGPASLAAMRVLKGSGAGGFEYRDQNDYFGQSGGYGTSTYGLRVASAVPSPAATFTLLCAGLGCTRRDRRRQPVR